MKDKSARIAEPSTTRIIMLTPEMVTPATVCARVSIARSTADVSRFLGLPHERSTGLIALEPCSHRRPTGCLFWSGRLIQRRLQRRRGRVETADGGLRRGEDVQNMRIE